MYIKALENTPDSKKWALVRSWMRSEPLNLYAELRKYRPVLELPELVLVTRHADCTQVLLQHDVFSVAPYRDKMGAYFMTHDDTAEHWREKSAMKCLLDYERLGQIRQTIANIAQKCLVDGAGKLEAVGQLMRKVPVCMVDEVFGFANSDHAKLIEWSYWNQMDSFWNQPFDAPYNVNGQVITTQRKACKGEMETYLGRLAMQRVGEIKVGKPNDDPFTRLMLMNGSNGITIDAKRIGLNIGGLLIGTIETTAHAAANAIEQLFSDPQRLAAARKAAKDSDPEALTGHAFEALRFQPAFPYFFRQCEKPTHLGLGTDYKTKIEPGTIVLAVTHSAMFDEHAFWQPQSFDPTRSLRSYFHFGLGIHECLGRAIGMVAVTELVRAALLLDDLDFDPIDRKGGPVPESWAWRYSI